MRDAAILLLLWRLLRVACTFCWFEKLRTGARNSDRFAWERSSYRRKLDSKLKSGDWFVRLVYAKTRETIINSRLWSHYVSLCSRSVPFCSRPVLSVLSVVDYQVFTLRQAAYCRESWYGLYCSWLSLKFQHGRDCPDALRCFPHALQ